MIKETTACNTLQRLDWCLQGVCIDTGDASGILISEMHINFIYVNTAKVETRSEILPRECMHKGRVVFYGWEDETIFIFLPAFFKCNLMNSYHLQKCETNYPRKSKRGSQFKCKFPRQLDQLWAVSAFAEREETGQIRRPPGTWAGEQRVGAGVFKVRNSLVNGMLWPSYWDGGRWATASENQRNPSDMAETSLDRV